MPFVQMENISHFLRACETPPLSLPAHDRFLTVDLFDQKDPAQVIQCIAAFSRRANQVNPTSFPTTIGAKAKGGAMSPQGTGASVGSYTINTPPKQEPQIAFNTLNRAAYSSGGRTSPTKQPSLARGGLATGGSVSSWSNANDETRTAPAWNIHQYGYMGGASQGNQGVAFGSRRQLVSPSPHVPSLAEKEKRLKEQADQRDKEVEEERQRNRQAREQEEMRAREEEQRRWEEETRKLKQQEQRDEDERLEKLEAEKKAQKDRDHEAAMMARRNQQRQESDSRLNGQFLSQYQAQQPAIPRQSTAESQRIADLERQLAEAKEAERRYQQQEQDRLNQRQQLHASQETKEEAPPAKPARPLPQPQTSNEDDWDASEREFLKKQWDMTQKIEAEERPAKPPRPTATDTEPPAPALPSRPLPDPTTNYQAGTNRTDRFLSSNPAPSAPEPRSNRPQDFSTTTEVDLENQRRLASQTKTKAGGWASKSLLEREMERERERQREWEESQKETADRARDLQEGSGPGQTWDVHQYGYMGGDNQNRGGPGLGIGGARRQIIGPRPPP